MNFLFACGGTAGHINPALAVAEELRRTLPDSKILFVGAGNVMEKSLIPNAGYELANIRMSGLKRGFSPGALIYNVKTARNLVAASGETARIIREFKPQAVIGTGGYICYPVLKKAARMKIPTIVHESNAIPGLTTKLLSTIVDKVLVSFPGLEKNYRQPDRVVFTGTPVRGGFEALEEKEHIPEHDRKPLVLSFWGSLGAARMNEIIIECMKLNIKTGEFNHIHAAGRLCDAEEMNSRLRHACEMEELPPGIEIKEYIDDIQSLMAQADIVLCRAGGSTIAELTAMGKPAVLIPSPYVSNNEQVKNARQLLKAGGAVMLEEKNCTGKLLFDTVSSMLKDEKNLMSMSAAQKAIGSPDATEKITKMIIAMAEQNNAISNKI